MLKVAVVILNWNGRSFLEHFLELTIKNTENIEAEVIVADNGSTDDSLDYLNHNFPTLRIIRLNRNYGFAEGYNLALKQVDAQYFVLLNSDVEVTPNWIKPITDTMDADPKIGACMPKLKQWHNKKKFEYAGAAGGFIDMFGYPFCRGRILDSIEEDSGQYNDACEIFWATGACFIIRAELYNQLDGLDGDFFAHMEEIDLCWRIKNRGYKIMFIPNVEVYHVGGGTLPNNSSRKIYLNYRNNLYLLYKNLPSNRLWVIILMRMCLDFVSALVYITQGKFAFYLSVVKAHWAFMFTLSKMRAKRKILQQKRVTNQTPHIYPRSIVYDFFIKKIKKYTMIGLNIVNQG